VSDHFSFVASFPRPKAGHRPVPGADGVSPGHGVVAVLLAVLALPIRTSSSSSSSVPSRPRVAAAEIPETVKIGVARGGGYAVQTIRLEDYVAGVLAGEAARDTSPAALEALAITIRTYALANSGRHRADGFDLCDQTHCQVLRKATPSSIQAASITTGRILVDHGAAASVYYSASCGGRTERPSQVWPGAPDPPFLPSRKDDACEGTPAWDAELSRADLSRALQASGFKGSLRNLRIRKRNSSGRVIRLELEGFEPDEISGQDLRAVVGRTLGWQHIKSTSFELRRTRDGFLFSGHGYGHGVGLCVTGAARLAEHGRSAEAILARYFPGLKISRPQSR